jgi:multidrug efflux pump subunit AcrA (membrane-fusion protein)
MKNVKSMDSLKDSALLYEKTLPGFGYILLLVLLALLAGVVVWSINTPKVYVVKSSGNVQSVNKNYIMAPYTGEVVGIDIEEGYEVEQGDTVVTIKSPELNLQQEQLEGQKNIYVKQIAQYNKLVKSIQEDVNLFNAADPDDNLYYSQYEMYKGQIGQQKMDTSTMKAYGYTDAQIEIEIYKNQGKIDEVYYSHIRTAEEQILQAQTQLEGIEAQLAAIETGQDSYEIRANTSGKIHMLVDCKEGMVVQATAPIASIGAENDRYKIIAYVSASNTAMLEGGDEVDIAVAGLQQNVYGTIPGEVVRVDSDITIPQSSEGSESAQPYFKVEIKPEAGYLVSKDGHKVNLSNGMVVETRIKYDRVSYFDYVMESLGMKVRG